MKLINLKTAYVIAFLLLLYKTVFIETEHADPSNGEAIQADEYEPYNKNSKYKVDIMDCVARDETLFDSKSWQPDSKPAPLMRNTYQISPQTDDQEVVLFCKQSPHYGDSVTTLCKQIEPIWHRLLKNTDIKQKDENEEQVCKRGGVRLSFFDVHISETPPHGIVYLPAIVYFETGRADDSVADLSNSSHRMAIYSSDSLDINDWKTWITKLDTNVTYRNEEITRTKTEYNNRNSTIQSTISS